MALANSMADLSTFVIMLILVLSAGLMIWQLLKLRQKNMLINSGHFDEDYSGEAKNPEKFMEPDEDALEEMQELLDKSME